MLLDRAFEGAPFRDEHYSERGRAQEGGPNAHQSFSRESPHWHVCVCRCRVEMSCTCMVLVLAHGVSVIREVGMM